MESKNFQLKMESKTLETYITCYDPQLQGCLIHEAISQTLFMQLHHWIIGVPQYTDVQQLTNRHAGTTETSRPNRSTHAEDPKNRSREIRKTRNMKMKPKTNSESRRVQDPKNPDRGKWTLLELPGMTQAASAPSPAFCKKKNKRLLCSWTAVRIQMQTSSIEKHLELQVQMQTSPNEKHDKQSKIQVPKCPNCQQFTSLSLTPRLFNRCRWLSLADSWLLARLRKDFTAFWFQSI